jgi:hypothetical protein
MEMLARDKRSSLFGLIVSDKGKKVCVFSQCLRRKKEKLKKKFATISFKGENRQQPGAAPFNLSDKISNDIYTTKSFKS